MAGSVLLLIPGCSEMNVTARSIRSPLFVSHRSKTRLQRNLLTEDGVVYRRLVFIPDSLAPALGKQVIFYLYLHFRRSDVFRNVQFVLSWLPSHQAGVPQVDNKRPPQDGTFHRVGSLVENAALFIEQSQVYRQMPIGGSGPGTVPRPSDRSC